MEYLCHKWSWICSTCLVSTSWSFPHSWLIIGFVTKSSTTGATSRAGTAVHSEALEFTPPPVLLGFVVPLVVFLWPLHALSVLLRFMDDYYPFGIFKLFLHQVTTPIWRCIFRVVFLSKIIIFHVFRWNNMFWFVHHTIDKIWSQWDPKQKGSVPNDMICTYN